MTADEIAEAAEKRRTEILARMEDLDEQARQIESERGVYRPELERLNRFLGPEEPVAAPVKRTRRPRNSGSEVAGHDRHS